MATPRIVGSLQMPAHVLREQRPQGSGVGCQQCVPLSVHLNQQWQLIAEMLMQCEREGPRLPWYLMDMETKAQRKVPKVTMVLLMCEFSSNLTSRLCDSIHTLRHPGIIL